jgi:NAD(P)-dependent dehydrogenase (short-subunit alcohol dehydrogenase family)
MLRLARRSSVMSRNVERVDAAAAQLRRHGGEALGFVGDVRDMEAVRRSLAGAHAKFGEIDVLVSGAAGNFLAPALDISSNGFRAVVDIDLVGTFHVLRAGFDLLRRPGASLINISAPQSTFPSPMQVMSVPPRRLDQVCACFLGWGPYGVRVNSIMPGPIADTGGLSKLVSEAERSRIEGRIPLRRVGQLGDIAEMALFLGSTRASYITGALIPVDGGISLLGGRNYAGDPEPTRPTKA